MVFTMALPLSAAPIIWEDQKSYNWHNAANWSPAVVPGATSDAWVRYGIVYIMDGAANARTLLLGGDAYAHLDVYGTGNSITTWAGADGALGLDVRSGSLTVEKGASLTTQAVEIRGTGGWDEGVIVATYDNSAGRPSRWLNTGNMTLHEGGKFIVESGAFAESRNLTVIDGGNASISAGSTWQMDRLVIEDNSTNDDPDLVVTSEGTIITKNATVRGVVSMSPRDFWDYRRGASWNSESILADGGTIDLAAGSHLKTGLLSIQGGEVLIGHGKEAVASAEIGKLEAGGGGKLVLNGGTLIFRESGFTFSGVDPGEVVIGNGGAVFETRGRTYPAGKNDAVVINASLQGSGGLETWTFGSIELAQASTYQGDTVVLNGTLIVDNREGSATGSGAVRVGQIGTLAGSGFIAGNVINDGTVSPGNSPGTLHINGDFHQNSDGTLLIEVGSPETYDILNVGGNVHIGGSLVVDNDKPLKFGQQINLIQAHGRTTGFFDSIAFSNPPDARILFESNEGTGTLSIAPLSYSQVATSPNETILATALDPWIGSQDGDKKNVSRNLDQLTAAEYQQAFSAISPAIYGAALDTAIEQSQSQSTTLAQHLASRRLREVPATLESKDWEAWTISSGLYSTGSMSSLAGNEFSSGNFLSGIERKLDATFTAGLFTGFGDSEGTFSGASRTEQDRLTFGGYVTAQQDGYYANTALGAGILDMDVTRSIRFGGLSRTAKSSTDGSEFFGLISGGYDLHANNWTFGPTAGFQYSKVRYDDVKEHGAGALDLAIENPEDDSLRSQIGARVAYRQKANDRLTLIPEARLFWQHEFLRNNTSLDATLEQGSGPGFTHRMAKSDGDSLSGGVALGFQTPVGFYGNVSYDVEAGRESNLNQTLSIGADWRF